MFTEQQLAAFNAMNHEQIQKRFKEIQDEVNRNDPNSNLEMLQAEFDILQKRDKELQDKAAQRRSFLDTMAKSIEDEEVLVEFGTSISPCLIKSVENSEYVYMILPIRLKE